ncbi:MAG: hypothetical protein EAX86_05755 [Candidatus Heimdallarchaeota archaeon]|nr:hypothetical protein [Candidatus Heimdallarchaeota archaeon]
MSSLKVTSVSDIINLWNKQNSIPLNISIIDDTIGGLLPGFLHGVIGDSGVGKTNFCLRSVKLFFKHFPESHVLYCNLEGHLRKNVLEKSISNQSLLAQISLFNPKSLLELMIFFNELNTKFDFIIIDSIFGAPVDAFEYFYKKNKIWEGKIFDFLLSLKSLARSKHIPIMMTNNFISSESDTASFIPLNQSGKHLITPFVPIEFIISKTNSSHILNLRFFEQSLGQDSFRLFD